MVSNFSSSSLQESKEAHFYKCQTAALSLKQLENERNRDDVGVELKMTDIDSLTSPNNEYFIALQLEL